MWNLYPVPFEIGVLHYASDTPMSKGRNLGEHNLSYYGMDPTYATTIAILRRILALEISGEGSGAYGAHRAGSAAQRGEPWQGVEQ